MSFRTIVREPLLHFLLLGLALFILYGQVSPGDSDSRRIIVGQRQIDTIVEQYRLQWNRPPTAPELRTLIDTQVHDEIVYREGKAMGLDRDDAVVRRRVRQKYELMAEEEKAAAEPTDTQLDLYRRAHGAKFTQPGIVSFDQRLFPVATSSAAIEAARKALERHTETSIVASPSSLPPHVAGAPLDLVARDFGRGFAAALASAPVGQWAGPLPSSYGVHLVRLSLRTAPTLLPLADIRAAVTREWENDERSRASVARYAKLRAGYDVHIAGQPGAPR